MDWNLFIVPLVLIAVELLKRIPIPTRWLPHIAVLIGGALGAVYVAVYGGDWLAQIVSGIVYGAAASGIYDLGTSTLNT